MNLPAPCSLRGSPGGGARLRLSPARPGGERGGFPGFQPGRFIFQPEGGIPATLPRFPEPPLPHPSANPAGCRGPGDGGGSERGRVASAAPAGASPSAAGATGTPRQRRVAVLLPGQLQRDSDVSLEIESRVPRPRERGSPAVPGLAAPFPELETTPQPGTARRAGTGRDGIWDGIWDGTVRPWVPSAPLCRR